MIIRTSLFISLLSGLAMTTTVLASTQEHAHEQHSHNHTMHAAHEHGVAEMQLTIVKDQAMIEVNSPLFNVVGFEHAVRNDAQAKRIEEQIEKIKHAQLFKLGTDKQCKIASVQVQQPFSKTHDQHLHEDNHKHDHDGHHEDHTTHEQKTESSHRDLSFAYQYQCQDTGSIRQLDTSQLFHQWSNLQHLRVEWIFNHHQSAATLHRENPILILQE